MSVISEIISLFSAKAPAEQAAARFQEMLELSRDMVVDADKAFWAGGDVQPTLDTLRLRDIEVNSAQREVRRYLAVISVDGTMADATRALGLMSLVKDVERLGDYAKNLAELALLGSDALPDDSSAQDLKKISTKVVDLLGRGVSAFMENDTNTAQELTVTGREIAKLCDEYVRAEANSSHSANTAVRLALAARFYKRVAAHLLNVLSSLLMPLHKLDYFDEKQLS